MRFVLAGRVRFDPAGQGSVRFGRHGGVADGAVWSCQAGQAWCGVTRYGGVGLGRCGVFRLDGVWRGELRQVIYRRLYG